MGSPPAVAPEALRDVACVLCGSDDSTVMHRKDPYRIERCVCGMVYTSPRLPADAIRDMYQDDYWNSDAAKDFGYTDYLADAELYLRTYRMRSALMRKHVPPPASVLDVGCAAGFCLQVLQEQGYDVHGVELSGRMAAEAGRRIGDDRVHHGILEEGLFGGKRYDLITFWDVVEHVEDPAALLRTARAMLNPGGHIILETQNVASRFAKLLGVRWQHYKFQEHLHHFDPKTIERLLGQAGLDLVAWSPRRGGKYVSVKFVVERAGRVHPIFSVLLSPLRLLGDAALYINVFDEMLVVATPSGGSADG